MKPTRLFAAAIALTSVPLPARAAAVLADLSFDTLPSAQGWTYSNSGPHGGEGSHFTVAASGLNQNTLNAGNGIGSAEHSTFPTSEATAGATGFTVVMDATVSDHVVYQQPELRWSAFRSTVMVNGKIVRLGILPDELYLNGTFFTPSGFDGTVENEYLMIADFGTDQVELFVNGTSVQTRSLIGGSGNYVYIGDGTGRADAAGRITRYTVSVVPEPGGAALSALACACLLLNRRRR